MAYIDKQDLLDYFSLIRISLKGIPVAIKCGENTVTRSFELPVHPTDRNMFIGDTVYEEPKTITMEAFIESGKDILFNAQIKLSTALGLGFTIFTMGGVYTNMFVQSFEKPETADINNGHLCSITFQEVPDPSLLGIAMAVGEVAVATAANTAVQGTVNPKQVGKETGQAIAGGLL